MSSGDRFVSRRLDRSRRLAERRPLLYRARLVAFAAFGYACLLCVIGCPLVAAAFFGRAAWTSLVEAPPGARPTMPVALAVASLCGLAAVLWALYLSIRHPPPAPSGIILRREDAPALFDAVERLRVRLNVPPIRRILLVEEFNASVAVVPRLAGLGGTRTYLLVGLPLMQALSPEQLDAVLAHELGHVSGGLNRLLQWFYRWNLKWEYLARSADGAGVLERALLAPFARWYSRRLLLASHAMLSGIEIEADLLARSAVGRSQYAEGFLAAAVRESTVEDEFLPEIRASMARDPRPPDDYYVRLRAFLARPLGEEAALGILGRILARQPDARDTHPTPRQRLAALGVPCDSSGDMPALLPRRGRMSAAEFFLGDAEEELTRLLSATWKQRMAAGWLNEHRDAVLRESELLDLRRRDAREGLDDDALWRMARLTEEFLGRREAFGLYLRYLEANRDDPKANLAFGRILLEEGGEDGVPFVEFAMEADPFLAGEGCDLVCRWLGSMGRHEEAGPWQERAAREANRLRDAVAERQSIGADSPLTPHDLDRIALARLIAQLGEVEEVAQAWLARLQVEHFPEKPAYVLAVQMAPGLVLDREDAERMRDWLGFEDHLIVFAPQRVWERLLHWRMKRLAGARLLERG